MLHHENTTGKIIGAAFEVHNQLGYGFLEKVYQNTMRVELTRNGCRCETEHDIKVSYKGVVVGHYMADLLVDDAVIVELKVARQYNPADEARLLNELKATGMRVGLLINFGKDKLRFRRFAY